MPAVCAVDAEEVVLCPFVMVAGALLGVCGEELAVVALCPSSVRAGDP